MKEEQVREVLESEPTLEEKVRDICSEALIDIEDIVLVGSDEVVIKSTYDEFKCRTRIKSNEVTLSYVDASGEIEDVYFLVSQFEIDRDCPERLRNAAPKIASLLSPCSSTTKGFIPESQHKEALQGLQDDVKAAEKAYEEERAKRLDVENQLAKSIALSPAEFEKLRRGKDNLIDEYKQITHGLEVRLEMCHLTIEELMRTLHSERENIEEGTF